MVSAAPTRAVRPTATTTNPKVSNLPGSGCLSLGTNRSTASMPRMPIGTLTKKMKGQSAKCRIRPAMAGPVSGPTRAGMVYQLMAETSCSRGEDPTTISRPTGVIIAPPRPCRIRNATSSPSECDRPHITEANRKTPMAQRNTRRGP